MLSSQNQPTNQTKQNNINIKQLTRTPSIVVQDCKDPSSGFLINKHELSYEEFHGNIDWSHLYFHLSAYLNSLCTIINSRLMESCKPLRYWYLSADEYIFHWNNPSMDVGVFTGVWWLQGLAWSMCCFRRAHTCTQSKLLTQRTDRIPLLWGILDQEKTGKGIWEWVLWGLCSESMRTSESIKFSVGTLIELQNRYRNSTDSLEPLRKIKNPNKEGETQTNTYLPPLSWFYFSIE